MNYILHMIKFVSDLRQVGGFPLGTLVSSNNKNDHHDITEIFGHIYLYCSVKLYKSA